MISDLLRLFLVPFRDEIATVEQTTAKSSHCVWMLAEFKDVALLCSAAAAKQPWGMGKKKMLASYCTRSVVALWSWKIQILTVCHGILISCVGRCVSSYICADLLSIREDSPSKGGFHGTHEAPSNLPLGMGPRSSVIHPSYYRSSIWVFQH